MKVLVALARADEYPYFGPVVPHLHEAGHDVKVLFRNGSRQNLENDPDLEVMFGGPPLHARFDYEGRLLPRRDKWAEAAGRARGSLDHALYSRRQHPFPELAKRREKNSPRPVQALVRRRWAKALVSVDPVWRLARRLERVIPADPDLIREVAWEDPDVVVVSPSVGGRDLDYARAAGELGIPTVALPVRWTDLTTKWAVHFQPDAVLLWNEALAAEARSVHALPASSVQVVGSVRLDPWFELGPSSSREALCARAGLDPERPFVLYVASRLPLDEAKVAHKLRQGLDEHPAASELQVLVRPHPRRRRAWAGSQPPGLAIWPDGAALETPARRQDFYDMLAQSSAVVGISSEAFIEAAAVDRPCLAIERRGFHLGPELEHIQTLAGASFIDTARDGAEAAEKLAVVVGGADERAAARRGFAANFLRANGRPAASAAAEAIERVGGEKRTRSRRRQAELLGPAEHRDDPLLIGGNGGSGTRVFTRIASCAGIFMGHAIDTQEDSQPFAKFYARHLHPYVRRGGALSGAEREAVDRGLELAVRRQIAGIAGSEEPWGSKHPRTMLLLDLWQAHYPRMKFLHVVRSGLDMAFSTNQNQLMRYGPLLLSEEERKLDLPSQAILFWERSNAMGADYGEAELGDRYLRIRLEDLCEEPEATVRELFDFFEAGPGADLEGAVSQVATPPTLGRWRERGEEEISALTDVASEGLRRFGYSEPVLATSPSAA